MIVEANEEEEGEGESKKPLKYFSGTKGEGSIINLCGEGHLMFISLLHRIYSSVFPATGPCSNT